MISREVKDHSNYILYILMIVVSGVASTLPFLLSSSFHNSQRLLSILGLGSIAVYQIISNNKYHQTVMTVFAFFLIWGGFLVSQSPLIEWSLLELLLFALVALVVTNTYYPDHQQALKILSLMFIFAQGVYVLRAVLNYIFIVLHQTPLDVWNVIDGFDNIRFYAQFLSWTIPFLVAYLYTHPDTSYQKLFFLIVTASWMLVLMTGTRAFMLGIIGSVLVVAWVIPSLWKTYTKGIIITGLCGLSGYWVLTYLLPSILGIDNTAILGSTSERDFTSSSGRVEIWQTTIQLITAHPFMGIGPMMTALEGIFTHVAHPHNFLLQLAAEWGLPFAIAFMGMFSYITWQWKTTLQNNSIERATLALPVTAAISSAMTAGLVDGIIVMPVSLLYLTMIAGFGFSLGYSWAQKEKWITINQIRYIFIVIPLAIMLLTTYQWSVLSDNDIITGFQPRFWADGKVYLK